VRGDGGSAQPSRPTRARMADHQLHAARGGRVEAGDQDPDTDAVDQHHPLKVQTDPLQRATQCVVDGIPQNVGVVEVDLSAGRDLDGAVGELAAGDRQVHGCSLPGAAMGTELRGWCADPRACRRLAQGRRPNTASNNIPLVCKLRHVGAERQSSSYGQNVLERSGPHHAVDDPQHPPNTHRMRRSAFTT